MSSNRICYSTKSHRLKWAKLAEFTYQVFFTILQEKPPEAIDGLSFVYSL